MTNDQPGFEDEALRSALKRSTPAIRASPELRARVASMLIVGAPVAPAIEVTQTPTPKTSPRVFGLPRNVGLAAALALLLLGGGMIYMQLREFFPSRVQVVMVDRVKAMIDSLVMIHRSTPLPEKVSTDLTAFQRALPSSMPLATLPASKAQFVNACVDALDGQICYCVRYLVDGKPFTLVTGAPRMYYEIPKYNQIEVDIRLVGGERDGYLVCLMGDAKIAEPTFQTLFADVKMLASPSTQPVGSVVVSGPCAVAN